jgi:hypothetical protein
MKSLPFGPVGNCVMETSDAVGGIEVAFNANSANVACDALTTTPAG